MFARFKLNAEITYYLLSGAMTLFDSTMFVYLTVFYFTVVGLKPLELVLVGTALEGSILLFEVPTGVVADTYSRRLSVLLGVLTLGIGFAITSLARSFLVVISAQVVCGLGYTFLSGATDAWLADEVGETQVGRVYLKSGQINRLLGILGILASAVLASFRLDLPILVGGLLYVLLFCGLAVVMPEKNFHPAAHSAGAGLPAMLATFRLGAQVMRGQPFLIWLVLINFIIGAASEGFDRLGDAHLAGNFVFPALTLPGLGALKPVAWFSVISLAASLINLLVVARLRARLEPLSQDRRRTAQALAVLNVLSVGATVVFALAGSFPLAVGALLLRGVAGALIWPLFGAFQVQAVGSQARATVLSMTSQGNALGQVLGGPLVGWQGNRSLRAALMTAGLLFLPNSLLYARGVGREESRLAELSPAPTAPEESGLP